MMFPFIIKGKVPLGLRRDYHLSEAGLEERIAERLIKPVRKSGMRTDGSPSGDGRGLLAGGLSRLLSMGFLTVVRVRKIRIISRNDFLFAGYEMDATVSTLVNMVIIPLVLGSILFSHSAFSFYEALGILVLLVLTSWGLEVFFLIMMVRHEIYQIASEIRAIMRRHDTPKIDLHHQDLAPEDLLATAYYYERNGLIRRCEAYLVHLVVWHPESFETILAREHMEHLDGIPSRPSPARTREGESKNPPASGMKNSWIKRTAAFLTGRRGVGTAERDGSGKVHGSTKKRRKWFRLPAFFKRKKKAERSPYPAKHKSRKGSGAALKGRRRVLFGPGIHGTPQERTVRRRQERLERREAFARAPDDKKLTWGARMKLRLSRLIRWEGRDERRYRRERERWFHGPRPPKPKRRMDGKKRGRRQRLPNWMKSREERQALDREKRWSEGLSGPGSIQRNRDRWGKWRLFRGEKRAERLIKERRTRATEESPHV
jgi:hypothetical protein